MNLSVRIKPGAHRDGLWREGDGLYAQLRVIPKDDEGNDYLVQYLSGSLRVAKSLITIVRGRTSSHKLIRIDAQPADLQPMLDSLPPIPQATLFED